MLGLPLHARPARAPGPRPATAVQHAGLPVGRPSPACIRASTQENWLTLGIDRPSERTLALWRLSIAASQSRGYVLILRGKRGWAAPTAAGDTSGIVPPIVPGQQFWRYRSARLNLEYDSTARVLRIGSRAVDLTRTPVVLIDRVDGVGGRPFVAAALCPSTPLGSIAGDSVVHALLRGDARVRRFAR